MGVPGRRRLVMVIACLGLLASCGDDLTVPSLDGAQEPDGLAVAAGLQVDVLVEGLRGPTQFTVLEDGSFVVAEINGGENDGAGRVVRVDGASGDVEVLLEDLDKPTGVAVLGDELWVMERDRLTRGVVGADRRVVAEGLPNNGRSQGTLTVLPDGRVLFDTSGSKRGSTVAAGSGRLFTVDAAVVEAEPVEFASGFKHAYAHAVDAAGVLWSTEMTDGSFDGLPAADEVVAVVEGADHGWPRCVGDNRAVAEYGVEAQDCRDVPASQVVFAPAATPTGMAPSPFTEGVLWVALWNERRVVAVSTDPARRPAPVREVVSGMQRPQHLVTVGEEVFVSDFGSGRILRLRRAP